MNTFGINADKLNEKMLQIANALKPLGVFVECEKNSGCRNKPLSARCVYYKN